MPNTYFEARKWAFSILDEPTVDLILMTMNDWTHTQLVLNLREKVSDFDTFKQVVERVAANEPVQYVLHKAAFYGRDFYVDGRVLIPRMETEELVEWILADNPNEGLNVLDIGTGSGAISITLQAEKPTWHVTGSDISADAIAVAQQNGATHHVTTAFVQSDLFKNIDQKFDIIVSNPPYIADSERAVMDESVLEYEPDLALFADNEGLALYQGIADGLASHLNDGGSAYFEIGYLQGPAVVTIMQKALPEAEVTLKKDISGQDRMVRVRLPK
jgi:release factor glutamine methyltransferase